LELFPGQELTPELVAAVDRGELFAPGMSGAPNVRLLVYRLKEARADQPPIVFCQEDVNGKGQLKVARSSSGGSEERFNEQLLDFMDRAFRAMWETHSERRVDLRTAAYMVGIARVVEASRQRGLA
jgi:hypothetical protein